MINVDAEVEMSGERKEQEITEEDRRRFLKLAKNLGVGAGVLTVALARPNYAAASGFNRGHENDG